MGRKFWACPKPRGEGCAFFDWQDGQSNNNNNNRAQPQQRRSAAQLVSQRLIFTAYQIADRMAVS
jgi:hypothetical protein